MISIIAFFGLVFFLCVVLKRKFELVLPACTLLMMLVLTILAMLEKLLWVDGLAVGLLVAIAAALIYALVCQKMTAASLAKRFVAYTLTPGFVCFLCLVGLLLYSCRPMVVWWRDDIVQWGLQPKSLWAFEGLVDGSRHLNLFFATYTPGLQVLQWWLMHLAGDWCEWLLYFGLFITYGIFLLPLCERMRWKHAYLIPLMVVGLVAFPAWGNVVSYVFLGVDTSLALCFGFVLIQMWRLDQRDGPRMASIALGLCGLVLIKQIGLLFAAVAALFMLVCGRHKRQGKATVVGCLLSPLLVWLGWTIFCKAMGLSGYHTSNVIGKLTDMLSGTYLPPEGAGGVWDALMHSLSAAYQDELTFYTQPLLSVPKWVWLTFIALFPLLLQGVYPAKEMRRLSLFFAGMTAAYFLLQYVGFFTVFYDETSVYTYAHRDNMILLMERYMAPIMLGFAALELWLLAMAFPRNLARAWKPAPFIAAGIGMLALVLTVNWNAMYTGMLPKQYSQQERCIGAETETLMNHDWGESLQGYPDAKALVGLELNSDYIKYFRYTFAPAKFELPDMAFLADSTALEKHLLENNITHLICFDDVSELYEPAAGLTEEGWLDTWVLYEVERTEDGVTLVEFEGM